MFHRKNLPVRLLSLILSLAIALGALPAAASARSLRFTDVDSDPWYQDAVLYTCSRQLMMGSSDTTFSPEAATTRAMVITVLHRMEGTPPVQAEAFSDVPVDAWYSTAVCWARAIGLVHGYGDGTFRPGDNMSREEMVAVFQRYARYKGHDVTAYGTMSAFSDHAATTAYAQEAMTWAVAAGLIQGFPDGSIRPQAASNRAQLATVLMRYHQRFSADTVRITFFPNGSNVQQMPSTQYVTKGTTPMIPANPSRAGYVFAGWYTNATETDLNRQFDFTAPLHNSIELYARWIDISQDGDGDRIPDEAEPRFGTDPTLADTDGDGLNDYEECAILCTDPTRWDTDSNQLSDYSEDADGDDLINGLEFQLGLDPVMPDTDLDGLTDSQEVALLTDPLKADTDGDGANDCWEHSNGFNPNVFDDSFQVRNTAVSSTMEVSAEAVLPGGKAVTLTVEPITDHPVLNADMPGYLDIPFSYQVEGGLENASATISFTLRTPLSNSSVDPVIYYYDSERQYLQELPTQVSGNTYSTVVDHFSTYILLDRTAFNQVWEEEIKSPIQTGGSGSIDVVFVLDTSGSMGSNNRIRTAKQAVYTFLRALHEQDRGALVRFSSYAEVLSALTTDKLLLEELAAMLSTGGDTAMYLGLQEAVELLTDSTQTYGYKMIVLLSDGSDVPSTNYNTHYASLVNAAAANDITIYTIGAGYAVDTSTLTRIAEATGGEYYTATMTAGITDAFEQIQGSTVDLTTDSDCDGLPDYYEPLLTSGGGIPFGLDPYDPDWDDDGICDGDEIILTESDDGRVYGIIASDPTNPDTDADSYTDYDELYLYGTDPLLNNIAFAGEDVDFLLEDENFISDKYLDVWQNDYIGWLERACVGFWNGFGGKFDEVCLYKTILAEYLGSMVEERDQADELYEAVKLSHEILSIAIDDVKDAKRKATPDDIAYLENLEQQLRNYQKNISDIANSDYLNKGYTKDDVFAMWDKVSEDYRQTSDKVNGLKSEISFDETIRGKKGFSFSAVLNLADLGMTGYEAYGRYVAFKSDLASMDHCLHVLEVIKTSAEAPANLRTAAAELYTCIETQQAFNANTFADAVNLMGGKLIVTVGLDLATLIPVVGNYIAAVKEALEIADFMFNLSDVSEQCALLYAIAKSSSIFARDFRRTLAAGDDRISWKIVYDNCEQAAADYFALAILRKTSENQMKKADLANSFLTEWLFANYLYKISDVDHNIDKLNAIKDKYRYLGTK